jgi:hypothetical protein
VGIFDEFLKNRYADRVRQHIAAARTFDAPAPLAYPKDALLDIVLGTIGLGSDLGQMAGEDAYGTFIGQAAKRLGGDNADNAAIANAYRDGGASVALAQAREDPNRIISWGAGLGPILADPTLVASLAAGGASKAKDAPRALRLIDYALNRPADEIANAASPLVRQVIDTIGPMRGKAKPTTARQVAAGDLGPRELIDDATAKARNKKLPRQLVEVGKPLQPPDPRAMSLTPEQARQQARKLVEDHAARQKAKPAPVAELLAPPTKPAAIAPELAPVPRRKGKIGEVAIAAPAVGGGATEAVDFNELAKLMGGEVPPMDLTSPLKGSQKLGVLNPDVQDMLRGIAKQMQATPIRSGAGVGGVLGAAGAEDADGDGNIDPGERLRATLEGAAVGGIAGGATKVPLGTLKEVASIGHAAGKEGFSHALKEGKPLSRRALLSDWSQDKVVSGRNALLDELSGRARALMAGMSMGDVNGSTKSLIERTRATGAPALFSQETEDMLLANGLDPAEFNARQQFGQGFITDVLGDNKEVLHPAASAAAGAGYGVLDASNLVVPGAGVAFGALRGLLRPYTSEFFHATNDLTHMGIRDRAFIIEAKRLLAEVGQEMTDQLAAKGFDPARLSALNGKGVGLFSPTDLVNLGAVKEAEVWQNVLRQVYGAGDKRGLAGDFVVETFGDYGKRSTLNKFMNAVSPFSRYALGQVPVVARMVARNPAVALMVANFLKQTGGKIPVGTDDPLVGGLVQEELGGPGVEGEGSISPLSALLPVPTDTNRMAQSLDYADNPYEQALAIMEGLGFGVNPLLRAGGYVVGAEDLGPGTQSRYAGIEQALPGPKLPTIKGVLDNARKALAPIDKYGSDYDVVEARLDEVVLRETGKPLADPANHQLAVQLAHDPEHPFWKQAEEEALHGQAAKSAASFINPVTVSAKTSVKAQSDKAKKGMPHTPEEIRKAQDENRLADVAIMNARNAAHKKANPAAALSDRPELSDKEMQDPRLTAWERRNNALKQVNPKVYAQRRDEFIRLAGIR